MAMKLLAILVVAALVSFLVMRSLPYFRRAFHAMRQGAMRNPLVRGLVLGVIWRLIRLLLFRRF